MELKELNTNAISAINHRLIHTEITEQARTSGHKL